MLVAVIDLFVNDGAVSKWLTSLVETSALCAVCAFAVAVIRGRMKRVVFEE